MRTAYVLMYRSNEEFIVDAAKRETVIGKPKPYAVFEDSITAEKMKRDGDEIIEVPFFIMDQLVINDKALEGIPLNSDIPWKITYQSTPCKDSTMAPPYDTYPKVTCSNKTIDEHSWTNRSD